MLIIIIIKRIRANEHTEMHDTSLLLERLKLKLNELKWFAKDSQQNVMILLEFKWFQ